MPGFSSAKTSLDNRNWNSVSFSGQCNTYNIGAPNLPLMRRYFAIPPNAVVTVEVVDVEYEAFANSTIDPFQCPLLETETVKERKFTIDEKLYSTNTFYPENKTNRTGQRISAVMYLCWMETKDFTKTINLQFRK